MMDFNSYEQRKTLLKESLQELSVVIEDLGIDDLAPKVRLDRAQLDNEKFVLVVVGDFSRGKSTFVNAMLGKQILPSSVKPTTTVISKILYADKPSYKLVYKDGKSIKLDEKEFLAIKAPKEEDESRFSELIHKFNPVELLAKKNPFLNVDYAEVKYPLSFCENNVEVVDTPGINDIDDTRINITYNYLNKAEAAILVLSATQALSASELEFLKERVIGNQINDIFIVINYKDRVLGEEEKVLNFVKSKLQNLSIDTSKIFLVSSKKALMFRKNENGEKLGLKETAFLPDTFEETGFVDFEARLTQFLVEEKGFAKLQKYKQRGFLYIQDIKRDIKRQMEVVEQSVDELKQQLDEAKPQFEKIKLATQTIVKEMKSNLSLETQEIEMLCDNAIRDMRKAALDAVDNYTSDMDEDDVKKMINSAVTPIKKSLVENVNTKQCEFLKRENEKAIEKLGEIFEDISVKNNAIDIKSQVSSALSISVAGESGGNGALGAVGGYLLAAFLGVTGIGVWIAAGLGYFLCKNENNDVRSQIKQSVRKDFDKNYKDFTKKICEQYTQNSYELCDNLEQTVNERLKTMEKQLSDLVHQKELKEFDTNKVKEQLYARLNVVNKIEAQLVKVGSK